MYPNQQYGIPNYSFRVPTYQQPSQITTPVQQPVQTVQQSVVSYVTSKAQAEVAQIPFDGQPYFFLDTSTRQLYCKTFDPSTGMCPLVEYVPARQEPQPQYATIDMLTALENRIQAMLAPVEQEKPVKPVRNRKEADSE